MSHPNRLFDTLGPIARERLRPYVETVSLTKGRVLAEPGDAPRYAFFPMEGMISLLALTDSGQALEVAMVGHDGFVGVPAVLNVRSAPYQATVQVSGAAHRINAEALSREFQRGEELHAIVLTYVQTLIGQLIQSAVCHRFHALPERLCRWLLVSRACVRSNTIELTQESIAQMLGVSRPKVSQALVALEQQKLIHQGHGRIHVVDAPRLERSSCECYGADLERRDPQPLHHVR